MEKEKAHFLENFRTILNLRVDEYGYLRVGDKVISPVCSDKDCVSGCYYIKHPIYKDLSEILWDYEKSNQNVWMKIFFADGSCYHYLWVEHKNARLENTKQKESHFLKENDKKIGQINFKKDVTNLVIDEIVDMCMKDTNTPAEINTCITLLQKGTLIDEKLPELVRNRLLDEIKERLSKHQIDDFLKITKFGISLFESK